MRKLAGLSLVLASLTWSPTVVAQDRPAIVSVFADICLSEDRFDHPAQKARAEAEGWVPVEDDDTPELAAMMAIARAELVDPEYPDWTAEFGIYRGERDGQTLYLVVDHVVAPDVITLDGCYVYDFAATETVDPQWISDLLGREIAYSTLDEGDYYIDAAQAVGHVWGPTETYPRLFDTYLTLIPAGSEMIEQTGYDGLVLKTSSSVPDPAEALRPPLPTNEIALAYHKACRAIAQGDVAAIEAMGWENNKGAMIETPFYTEYYISRPTDDFGYVYARASVRRFAEFTIGECSVGLYDSEAQLDVSAIGELEGVEGRLESGSDGSFGAWSERVGTTTIHTEARSTADSLEMTVSVVTLTDDTNAEPQGASDS